MFKKLLLTFLVLVFLSACQSDVPTQLPSSTVPGPIGTSPLPSSTSTLVGSTTTALLLPTATAAPAKGTLGSTSPSTTKVVSTLERLFQPIIHEQPGDDYELVFSIPAGSDSAIQIYPGATDYEGPNAIAVLPDGSFIISDVVGYQQLLHYSQTGRLLDSINTSALGIGYLADIRVRGDELYLLDRKYQSIRVLQVTPAGELLRSYDIPYDYPINDRGDTIDMGLTGILVDCEGNIFLEFLGIYLLADLQTKPDIGSVSRTFFCKNKIYSEEVTPNEGILQQRTRTVIAGKWSYQTQLTGTLGSLRLLDAFPDGSLYLVREDVLSDRGFKVDMTVFFIGADGEVKGAARAPTGESLYYVMRSLAVGPTGEVYFLLARPDSVEVVRLVFYEQVEPFTPEAVHPNLTVGPNKP